MSGGTHSYFTESQSGRAQLHSPIRPQWTCRRCGLPWPCGNARDDLAASLPRLAIGEYMTVFLYQAAGELDVTPVELYQRFIAWTRGRE